MDFTYLDLKGEANWVALQFHLKRIKKEQFLRELLTKDNYLFVIGLLDQQIKLVVKIKLLLVFGINKEAFALLFLLIYFHRMMISCLQFMISIFAFGKQMYKFLYLQV